jgi:hypothetical protein
LVAVPIKVGTKEGQKKNTFVINRTTRTGVIARPENALELQKKNKTNKNKVILQHSKIKMYTYENNFLFPKISAIKVLGFLLRRTLMA